MKAAASGPDASESNTACLAGIRSIFVETAADDAVPAKALSRCSYGVIQNK